MTAHTDTNDSFILDRLLSTRNIEWQLPTTSLGTSGTTFMAVLLPLILVFLVGIARIISRSNARMKKIFPGPRGCPLIGDLPSTPVYGSIFHFKLLTDEYGPIAETNLAGDRLILIAGAQEASELLVGKGKVISSRPQTYAIKDALSEHGTAEYLPLMGFNEDHHRQRKAGQQIMHRANSREHLGHPTIEARRLMCRLADLAGVSQTSWLRMTEDYTSRITSRLAFGSPDHAERLHHETLRLLFWGSPNGALPNLIHPLASLPSWLSPWKFLESRRHRVQQDMYRTIYQDLQRRYASGAAPPCMLTDRIAGTADTSGYASDDDATKAIGMLAATGIFTISGPMQNFIRALACFPDWQPRLHAEMDAAVPLSEGRLPTLADLPRLPLLRAFLRETTRWRSVFPAGVPHVNDEDVVYRGRVIPKGTAFFPLEYAMNRDSRVYADPYTFDPMRWLDPASPNYRGPTTQFPTLANTSLFGWGRRYCIGWMLALEEIHLLAMYVVCHFTVRAEDSAVFEKNLLPGEKKGGHQWPQKSSEALVIMKPEPVAMSFVARDERMRELRKANEEARSGDILRSFGCVSVE